MIEPDGKQMSVANQCRILGVATSSYYRWRQMHSPGRYATKRESAETECSIALSLEYHKHPTFGYRRMTRMLWRLGYKDISERRVRRLMKRMHLEAVRPKRNLSKANAMAGKRPYLLKGLELTHPNQAWATDITYLRTADGGSMYLVAFLDLYSRKALSWRVSNSLDTSFCLEAFNDAIQLYGRPEMLNSDQGCQFTSSAFLDAVEAGDATRYSMDGKGRALDNAKMERLWRTVKYEQIYLKERMAVPDLKAEIDAFFKFYNEERPHQALKYRTPDEVYFEHRQQKAA